MLHAKLASKSDQGGVERSAKGGGRAMGGGREEKKRGGGTDLGPSTPCCHDFPADRSHGVDGDTGGLR